ncbi:MAG: hypothetical protein ACQEXJ_10105 [Myxococcota bacterium]
MTPTTSEPHADHTAARWGALAVACVVLASRLPLLPAALPDHDAVNFAMALEGFDLAAHRPHFPGYPVYLAVAFLFRLVGVPHAAALALPGVLLSALAAAAIFHVLSRRAGRAAAWAGALLYAVVPGLWLADLTPMSDAMGTHAATLALCGLLGGTRPMWVAAGLGLALGIRPSLAPLYAAIGVALLFRSTGRQAPSTILAALGGVLAWLVPLSALAGGVGALWELGVQFTAGHFTEWGGTALSEPTDGRLGGFAWNLGAWALGPAAGVALAAGLVARRRDRDAWTLALIAAPYVAWLLVGQNPDKPRHVLPLMPVLVLLAGPGLAALAARTRFAQAGVAAAVVATVAVAAPRAWTQARVLPAPLQALEWATARYAPESLQLYAGDDTGLWRHYAGAWRSTRVRSAAHLLEAEATEGGRPDTVLVTSRAGDLDPVAHRLRPLHTFTRSRLVDGPRHAVTLYRLERRRTVRTAGLRGISEWIGQARSAGAASRAMPEGMAQRARQAEAPEIAGSPTGARSFGALTPAPERVAGTPPTTREDSP